MNEEYRNIKYERTKKFIKQLREMGMDWEKISNKSREYLEDSYIREEDILVWKELVDYMKRIEERGIENEVGITISANNSNESDVVIPQGENSAWQILRRKFKKKDIYSDEELESVEKESFKILKQLSRKTITPVKGLVMGYVQSGKTTSIESLMAMAADNGWNFFIMLSGTIENLRGQGLTRLKEDIDYGEQGDIHWRFLENLNTERAQGLISSRKAIVTVCLKNPKRLEQLRDWIFSESTQTLKQMKIVLIDDEADQASLNTCNINKAERTKINKLIREIVEKKEFGAMNYVGYTATPYGNFLNEFGNETLYPKDFIHLLPKSTQYIGPKEVFGDSEVDGEPSEDFGNETRNEGLDIKRLISNEHLNDELKIIQNIEKGDISQIPESLKDAICWFIDTVAVERYKGKKTPISMLVHTNIKTTPHEKMSNAIKKWLQEEDKNRIYQRCKEIYFVESKKLTIEKFTKVLTKYNRDIEDYPVFQEIEEYVEEILEKEPSYTKINEKGKLDYHKGIHMVIDNCSYNGRFNENDYVRLAYPEKGKVDFVTAFIIVGGNTLSRGLTIEGLTTTYFCRKSSQMDTLMQMGRWFGYRVGYELLPRIWINSTNLKKFKELTQIEDGLREDLRKYERGITPEQYGPIIKTSYRTRLAITARNKMQSVETEEINYIGAKAQTVLFDYDNEKQQNNIDVTEDFLEGLGEFQNSSSVKGNLVKENVKFDYVKQQLLQKFSFCKQTNFFNNIDAFCEWIDNNQDEKLKKWNIIIANNTKGTASSWYINGRNINKVNRSKLSENSSQTYFSIGALRSTRDIMSDVDLDIKNMNEKEMISKRESIEKPQLIIYRIDKNSKPIRNNNREALGVDTDLIGLYIFVPGEKYKDYVQAVTIKGPKYEEEEEKD